MTIVAVVYWKINIELSHSYWIVSQRKKKTWASLAQLVARRSHNPKVVSSILTGGTFFAIIKHSPHIFY